MFQIGSLNFSELGLGSIAAAGMTFLSYSTQSGRQADLSRARTLSPSVGSIKMSSQGNPRLPSKSLSSHVLEDPHDEEGALQEEEMSPAKQTVADAKRKKGARKNLAPSTVEVLEEPKYSVGAEFEDNEDTTTANSEPSRTTADNQEDDEDVETPAKKKLRRSRKSNPATKPPTGKSKGVAEKARPGTEKTRGSAEKAPKLPVNLRVSQAKVTRSAQKND